MDLEALSIERNLWQTKTFEKISQSIGLSEEVELTPTEVTRSTKNIIVFGMTQAGKTCTLLAIAGIAFEHQEYIETLLRAGQEKGNSSTSTAIIYNRTSKENFGISYVSNGERINAPIFFDNDEIFKKKLIEIRNLVEENKHPDDRLNIYIPEKYFDKNKKKYNFNIIDLPGAGSRNIREITHVETLKAKYFDLAHVKIIVCSIEDIQSLQNDLDMKKLLPEEDIHIWQNLNSEYILVLTSAYSMESIKNHFSLPKKERDKSFAKMLETKQEKEILSTFGNNFNLEVYLFDVGESYKKLLDSLNEEDRKEIVELQEETIDKLAKSIEQRKGNTLKATIDKIGTRAKIVLKKQREEVEKEKNKYEEKLAVAIKSQEDHTKTLKELDEKKQELSTHIKKLKACSEKVLCTKSKFSINTKKLYQNHLTSGKLKDSQRALFISELEKNVLDYSKEILNTIITEIEEVPSLFHLQKDIDWSIEFTKYISDCIDDLNYNLKPTGIWPFKKFPDEDTVKSQSEQFIKNVKEWLATKTTDIALKINSEQLNKIEQQRSIESSRKECNKTIDDIKKQRIPELRAKTKICQDSILLIDAKYDASENLALMWVDVAKTEYKAQYNEYKKLFDSNSISSDRKMELLITMGLMERDISKMLK